MPLFCRSPKKSGSWRDATASPACRPFWKIKLPLILPSIGIISILTFVGNFNAFDLIYAAQGALAGPDFSTDILGTFMYRTFFGFQLQLGDPHMGSAIATAMFVIILIGVCIYLFGIQTRMRRYQLRGGRDHHEQSPPEPAQHGAAHGILILYTLIALFPVFVIIINSFKNRKAIFREPLALPMPTVSP